MIYVLPPIPEDIKFLSDSTSLHKTYFSLISCVDCFYILSVDKKNRDQEQRNRIKFYRITLTSLAYFYITSAWIYGHINYTISMHAMFQIEDLVYQRQNIRSL